MKFDQFQFLMENFFDNQSNHGLLPLEYTEIQELRVSLIEQFNIRDFIIDQDVTTIDDLNDIEISDSDIGSIDELIVNQLTSIQDHVKDDIDAKLLVELYSGLKIETDGNEWNIM